MEETRIPLKITAHPELCIERVPEHPCGIVIFGASGDLAHRKLLPALYALHVAKLLPKNFFLAGAGRSEWTDDTFREDALKTLEKRGKLNDTESRSFLERVFYQRCNYEDPKSLSAVGEKVGRLSERYKTGGNVIYYLAVPPRVYAGTIRAMGEAKLVHPPAPKGPWTHVVIEKPFGHDLDSAAQLDREIHGVLDESQIYRIDHYLGKETVQNILMFRFANAIFEPIWNNRFIDHVQIMAAETLGIEHRAGFYDHAGALRDVFQNHMLQLLALVAMEPPSSFTADPYRDEKVKVLRSIRPIAPGCFSDCYVRGQYDAGIVDGTEVRAYRKEGGVPPDSQTETFAAIKLFIDNWRWEGVPFYLRAGKRLKGKATELAVHFKRIPHSIIPLIPANQFPRNVLILRIEPDEGISLSFEAKYPGPKFCLATLDLDFFYKDVFKGSIPGAYERLLLDCMLADQTLFVRQDMVGVSWSFITEVLEETERDKVSPALYPAGSWGPKEADQLIQRDGRYWKPA